MSCDFTLCEDHTSHSCCKPVDESNYPELKITSPFDSFEEQIKIKNVNTIIVDSNVKCNDPECEYQGMCMLKFVKYIGNRECITRDDSGNHYLISFKFIKSFRLFREP